MYSHQSSSEERILQYVSTVSEEIFFVFNKTTNEVLLLTPVFEKVWEISQNEVKQNVLMLLDAVHEDDKTVVTNAWKELLTNKKRITIEFRIHTKLIQEKWIKLTACLFNNEADNESIVVAIAKDFTVEKEYNEKLYEFLNKKNSLLDILSHDMASPLNKIYFSAQLLNDRVANEKDETIMQLLELIEETSRNGINLIHSFFNKEFMSLEGVELIKNRTDIAERLREIVSMYHRSMHLTKINYRLITSSDHVFVDIDVIKFMQAIQNLITNAQKFKHDNGNITISVDERDAEVIIAIEDDGIGIPEELQLFLFQKYSKAKRAGIRGEPTVGLGLYIIKNIVEWHGGRVWYEPAKYRGSVFCIAIPKQAQV